MILHQLQGAYATHGLNENTHNVLCQRKGLPLMSLTEVNGKRVVSNIRLSPMCFLHVVGTVETAVINC